MASPYQQQVFRRKLIYIGLILVLFTGSWAWRRGVMDDQARALSIREESRGEVELTDAFVRLGLTGSRGLVTCYLWQDAIEQQKKNQWNDLEQTVRQLTVLQPHFITPWLFQSWNLAYNVSVESDRVRDKYFYVTRGVELLAEGERQNTNHPDLRWSIGFYMQHKICQSDETNVQRSLFQLSCIPPNERDPARFWKKNDKGEAVLNLVEFEKFCRQHPQLVRRLRVGVHRESQREKRRLFTCEQPADVVQFLEDNQSVPGLYRFTLPPPIPASARGWDPAKKDELLTPVERFPVLPPPHDRAFDREALNFDSPLGDDVDAYAAAQAWYSYAQEPLPEPGELPGSSKEITRPVEQRRPKYMTTLIFRNYPAQGRRWVAERLQQEGWFDDDDWDITDWFEDDPAFAGKTVAVGGGRKWSLEAWQKARDAWRRHGEENHLLFPGQSAQQRMEDLAARFAKKYPMAGNGAPPPLREEKLSKTELEEYNAARYMFELRFYRQVSNFMHHYHRCLVEAEEETVAARKLFYQAESLNLTGSKQAALRAYQEKRALPAWKGKKLNALEAWRDLVLLRNKEFRRDSFIQEQTAETQLRYLDLYNDLDGRDVKVKLAKAAVGVPLLPATTPANFPASLVAGPFDVRDKEGVPLIEERTMETVMDRMGLAPRKKQPANTQGSPGGPGGPGGAGGPAAPPAPQ